MENLNNYETKQALKKEYYANKAAALKAEADRVFDYDRKEMSMIPLGQPILVGHHSEKRHRRDLSRSHARLEKMQVLLNKAEYYERKATTATHAISSDDEDAIIKLKNKLANLEHNQIEMKRVNSEFKKTGNIDAIANLSEESKAALKAFLIRFPYYKTPFPAYTLTNNGAQIRRIKQRIIELEGKQKATLREAIAGEGYTISENKEDNRIWFVFDDKPTREVCQIMRHNGFKWSPSRGAWVRMLNVQGRRAADSVVKQIATLKTG